MDCKLAALVIVYIINGCLIIQGIRALRMKSVKIPSPVIRYQDVLLECHFDLESDILYSIKWYKDGNEFYRFVPRDNPQYQYFPLSGVTVDIQNSSKNTVTLSSVHLSSSGIYRCEVSGEAPSFQTVTDHGKMTVVALPEEGPRITGGRSRYQIGDTVRVNCTSGRSKPAASLKWIINGEPADPSFLTLYKKIVTGREGLETTILGLEFVVKSRHFKRGNMKLKCVASIESVYSKSNEESVEGERAPQRTFIIDDPDISPTTGSRADRVLASSSLQHYSQRTVLIVVVSSLFLFIRLS